MKASILNAETPPALFSHVAERMLGPVLPHKELEEPFPRNLTWLERNTLKKYTS